MRSPAGRQAPAMKRGTDLAALWAMTLAWDLFLPVCSGRYPSSRADSFKRNNARGFQDRIKIICGDIFQILDLAGRPPDLDGIDLCCLSKTEMYTKVILRKIAPSTA